MKEIDNLINFYSLDFYYYNDDKDNKFNNKEFENIIKMYKFITNEIKREIDLKYQKMRNEIVFK
jgi:Iap family predicted aminopeptidase